MNRNVGSVCVWVFVFLAVLVNASCTLSPAQTVSTENGRSGKVSPELAALYKQYSRYLQSHTIENFQPADPSVRVVQDRVIIDAVAAQDVNVLRADLVSLGMKDAVAFGRIVSGQLPISAIPAMGKLSSLQFARPASAVHGKTVPGSAATTGGF